MDEPVALGGEGDVGDALGGLAPEEEEIAGTDVVRRDRRAVLGLLTGNLERGAALKLRSGGIDPARFRVGAYGSDAAHRPQLPEIAARRAAAVFGRSPTGSAVVIIGDTPADNHCGEA
ncbi:MAG TPA: hypothetical protein VM387_10740, partial [Gemmatimonadales bacterium]|nr:hypothetical protein [Gemmatimonadales bacterium]